MTEQDTHLIWVLADDRAGNVNQAIGVAEALAQPFKRIDIGYTKWARLPNFIRGSSLIGVDMSSRTRLTAPWPDLVISAGRRTAPIARWIKKQSRGHSRICQIMRPDGGEGAFDLIAVPAHDQITIRENIVEIPGAPHRVTETRLLIEADQWRPVFKGLPSPRFAVIVGGNTKKTTFTSVMADELISKAIEAAQAVDGSLMVTTSRRTGSENEALIARRLEASGLAYHYHDWTSQNENPYFGYLALADVVIVTDDNPRTEDAAAIRAEVLAGAKGATEIADRKQAIEEAVKSLKPGDVLLVAGKGHEREQIIGDTVRPFSDFDAVRAALEEAA